MSSYKFTNNDDLNVTWDASSAESRSRRYPTREGDVRAKIYKMTQAKSNISFVYRESLRSMIAMFNDIGHFNSEDKFIDIKCIHGNAERAIAKLKQENSIILPMLSIAQTTSDNDDERRRYESVLVHEKYWDEEKHRAFRILRVPSWLGVRLSVLLSSHAESLLSAILSSFIANRMLPDTK